MFKAFSSVGSSVGKALSGSATGVVKSTPTSSLTKPLTSVPPVSPAAPKVSVPEAPTKITDAVEITPVKPASSTTSSVGLGIGAVGLGAGFLPMILNSSAVSGAITGAAQLGTVGLIADQVGGVANNLIDSVTGDPVNMAIAALVVGGLLYATLR